MTDQDEVLWNRTGRDALLAAAQTPQTLADYLFSLEGAISVYTGASPTPHTVLAPITFAQEVQFQGGTVVTGAQTITGNLTVDGNLLVQGTETIDLTETLLGLLTVNVASGDIAHFELAGTQVSKVNSLGQYVAIGSISTDTATYGDHSIVFAGTGEGLPFIQNQYGQQIQFNYSRWDFTDATPTRWFEVNVSGGSYAIFLNAQTFFDPMVVWNVPLGSVGTLTSWQVGAVEVAHIDNTGAYTVGASTTYADGTITTTGTLLATNATFQCLSGTALATGGTILQAFSTNVVALSSQSVGGTTALVLGAGASWTGIWAGNPSGLTFPAGVTPYYGVVFPGQPAWLLIEAGAHPGRIGTLNNQLDDGVAGAAIFSGLLTMSASASLTGTLSGVYTIAGTPTLGATLNPLTDNAYSFGSNTLRMASISAVDFLVYAAAGDAVQAILLGSVSGLFGLSLGPGGATAPDTTWVRTAAGIMGGSGIKTAGGTTAPANWAGIGASTVATAVSTTQNVVLICTAAGTQSAFGAINGISIGADFAPGQSFYLKANDTVTWTGTVAPTFVFMVA